MALVYTRRLVGPVLNSAASAWATVLTVPTGRVYVLRDILVANGGADASRAWLAVNGTGSANRVFIVDVPTSESRQVTTRLTLDAGETLRFRTTVTALQGTTMTITGYDFEG